MIFVICPVYTTVLHTIAEFDLCILICFGIQKPPSKIRSGSPLRILWVSVDNPKAAYRNRSRENRVHPVRVRRHIPKEKGR